MTEILFADKMFRVPGWGKKEEEVEELLAPVLASLGQHHGFMARLDRFIELYGGDELQRAGDMSCFRWYGTHGFACHFGGLAGEKSEKPPELLNTELPNGKGSSALFRTSTLPVASTFKYNGHEYVVVCNETRGQARQRMLFLALLRRVVEKMQKQ